MLPVSTQILLSLPVWSGFTVNTFVSCSNEHLRRNLQTPNDQRSPADSHAVGSCENVAEDLIENTVLVKHRGILGNITAGEVFALETAFLASYNTLASSCEEGYRNIVDVTIDTKINPGLSTRIQNDDENVQFSLLYRVLLRCIGCRSNPHLFQEEEESNKGLQSEEREPRGVKGRKIQERAVIMTNKKDSEDTKSKLSKEIPRSKPKLDTHTNIIMARSDDACFCVAPQESNFTDTFNDTLGQFQLNGVITSIDSVESVTEPEEVDCSQDKSLFQSSVAIEHTGVPGAVTMQELDSMEKSFVETYNHLNALNDETCDGLFRVVDSVDINIANSSGTVLAEQEFSWVYHVTGRCRGCDPLTNILVPGIQRSLSRTSLTGRRLQGSLSDSCFCPVNANERPPTEGEFGAVFNETVQFLRSTGEIVNIVSTNSARQLTTQPPQAPSSSSPVSSPSTSTPSSGVSPSSPPPQVLPPPTASPTLQVRRTPNPTSAPRLTPNPTSRPRITPNPTVEVTPGPVLLPTLPPIESPPPTGPGPPIPPPTIKPITDSSAPSLAPSFSVNPTESSPPSVSPSSSMSPSESLSPTIPVECAPFESIKNASGAMILKGVSNVDDGVELVTLPFTFNWFGDTPMNEVLVSSNGALIMDTSNRNNLCCDPHSIAVGGDYGEESVPRISVAQADLDPGEEGEIWTLDTGQSFIISWEGVVFIDEEENINAQVVLFPSGRVDIRWGNGVIPITSLGIAAGLEDDRRPQAIPATGLPFEVDGIASFLYPAFQCRTFQDFSLIPTRPPSLPTVPPVSKPFPAMTLSPTMVPSETPSPNAPSLPPVSKPFPATTSQPLPATLLKSPFPSWQTSGPSQSPTSVRADAALASSVSPSIEERNPTLSPSVTPSTTAPTSDPTDAAIATGLSTNTASKATTIASNNPPKVAPSVAPAPKGPSTTTKDPFRGEKPTTAPT